MTMTTRRQGPHDDDTAAAARLSRRAAGRARANATKRATWERLCAEPDAAPAALIILGLDCIAAHVRGHGGPPYPCTHDGCRLAGDPEGTAFAHTAFEDLVGEWRHAFCARFGVTMQYRKRFERRMWAAYADTLSLTATADHFTAAHRTALAAWLRGDGG